MVVVVVRVTPLDVATTLADTTTTIAATMVATMRYTFDIAIASRTPIATPTAQGTLSGVPCGQVVTSPFHYHYVYLCTVVALKLVV